MEEKNKNNSTYRIFRIEEIRANYENLTTDTAAKILFSLKPICALIIKGLIPDFGKVSLKEIVDKYLKDSDDPNTPYVKILSTELVRSGEMVTNFDLHYTVNSPSGRIYEIELEIQASKTDYPLLVRAAIYASRLMAGQQFNDKINYNLIHPVLSVWINAFNSRDEIFNYPIIKWQFKPYLIQSGIGHPYKEIGEIKNLEDLDLISIYMLNLNAKPVDGIPDPLIEELKHLLGGDFEAFNSFLEENELGDWNYLREEMRQFMTLDEYRFNQGIEKGKVEGLEEGLEQGFDNGVISVAQNMFKEGFNLKQVSKCCPTLNEEELLSIQEEVIKAK